jgi:hypothetical protein
MSDEVLSFEFPELQLVGRFLAGRAPVQAEGSVAGHRFYFRARHEAWEFLLSESPDIDPLDVPSKSGFLREGTYGLAPSSDASCMAPQAATAIIRRCAEQYFQSNRG